MRQKTFPDKILDEIVIGLGGARRVRFGSSRCTFQWAIPALKLGIELDSGFIARFKFDKLNRATVLGWRYMRFTHSEVRRGIAAEMIGKFVDKFKEAK